MLLQTNHNPFHRFVLTSTLNNFYLFCITLIQTMDNCLSLFVTDDEKRIKHSNLTFLQLMVETVIQWCLVEQCTI